MASAESRQSKWVGIVVVLGLIGAGVAAYLNEPRDPSYDPATAPEGLPRKVAQLLSAHTASRQVGPAPEGPIYLSVRRKGQRLAETWEDGDNWRAQVVSALDRLRSSDPSIETQAETIVLCLPHAYEPLRLRRKRPPLSNIFRGARGLELKHGRTTVRHCPTEMLARNASSDLLVKEFQRTQELSEDEFYDEASARSFEAHQLLITLGDKPGVRTMLRGNTLVEMKDVNRAGVEGLAKAMTDWMVNGLQPDGRMVYRYFPSRGAESRNNNMIRQFMASVCLVRLGNYHGDEKLREMAERNLRYNFNHFFFRDGDVGLITFRNKSKLGAAALAALGVVEAPFRDKLAQYELPLRAMTRTMQNADGSFQTFYKQERRDNQNFYPGETQLLWAVLYEQTGDPELLERIMRSFRYYRTWHLEGQSEKGRPNRNPAFIPWHTQALVKVWMKTQDPELSDFVFEMNDWLLGVQEWDGARYPDSRGRFYDGARPFGPPHASSTGVYLEGLIDAYRMAVAIGDEERRHAYRRAILRGLRSLMQLQFRDEVDMFYISKPKAVYGGIRTTLYDNSIRVDNVQHGLMGILRILETFNAEGPW